MDREPAAPAGPGRWWPLTLVLLGTGAAIVVIRVTIEGDRQQANTFSMLAAVLGGPVCLLWVLLFSPLSGRQRRYLGLGAALALLLLVLGFRLRGVTGDLMPLFEWRWSAPAAAPRPEEPAAPAAVPGLRDFPQFFGPDRDGRLAGPDLARDWQARPPRELWRKEVGAGWSGFAVAGRRAVTQEQYGGLESVVCYDVPTGAVLWVHGDLTRFESVLAGVGPRATPTIDGDRVFCQGATGILSCLELATGEVVWQTDILADSAAELPQYGVAGSPLVVGERVVVSAGGLAGRSLVAYDRATGQRVWSGGSAPAEWSSPVLAELGGKRQVLIFNGDVFAHDAEDGSVLWSHPWPGGHPHVCLPVVLPGDRVLVSSGYGTGSELLQIGRGDGGGFTVSRLWRSTRLKAKFTNVIAIGGYVYGLDDGILTCVDLADGRRVWKSGRYGHGQMLRVGDLLLVTAEHGEVVLLEPVPEEWRELGRFSALEDRTWNPPALAGEYLLVRNDRQAACYRLPVR